MERSLTRFLADVGFTMKAAKLAGTPYLRTDSTKTRMAFRCIKATKVSENAAAQCLLRDSSDLAGPGRGYYDSCINIFYYRSHFVSVCERWGLGEIDRSLTLRAK